jgi:dimethylargininase
VIALTRAVSPRIAECELTHLARTPIDVARAEPAAPSCQRCGAASG